MTAVSPDKGTRPGGGPTLGTGSSPPKDISTNNGTGHDIEIIAISLGFFLALFLSVNLLGEPPNPPPNVEEFEDRLGYEKWFYSQRAYPSGIPDGALQKAVLAALAERLLAAGIL